MKKMLLALGLILGIVSQRVHANTMEDVIQQNLGGIHNVVSAVATIQPGGVQISSGVVGATLWYLGTSTEADVTISQSGVQFYAPYNVPDTTVFPNTSLSYYDFTPSTATVGTFCQAVNASASYRCQLGGLRTDQPGSLLLDVTAKSGVRNLKSSGGFQVGIDTGGVTGTLASGLIGPTTTFMIAVGMTPIQQQHRVVLRKCVVNTSDATGLNFRVYGLTRQYEGMTNGPVQPSVTMGNGQTVQSNQAVTGAFANLSDASPVDNESTTVNTTTTIDYVDSQSTGTGLEFAKGAHVVVQTGAYPAGTVGQSSTNFLTCYWDEKP